MWIIPRNLQLLSGAPDTAGFISDLNEQSQICASSLMVRSKPSPARTWSQKWKRDSWTQHLSGRILRPSHARTFVTEWTSLWPVTPASPSAQPESVSAQTTLATSGHTSPDQYELFDLDYASLRMSKDTSASDSEKSLESWNQSVTKRRGEYSARLKSAHRTRESGSSSWPSPIASEVRQGFQDRSRGMKGSQESLTTVVVKDAANWLTPQEDDSSNVNPKDTRRAGLVSQVNGQTNWPTPDASNHRDGEVLRKDNNLEQGGFHGVSLHHAMTKYGQAAPANPSTDGSRQGLWPTITAHTPDMESSGPNGNSGTYLAGAVKAEENWVTPRTSGTSTRPNKTTPRQGLTLIEQAREQEKMWRTPSVAEEKNQNTSTQIYLQNQVGATPKAWATPNAFCYQPPENTEQWTKRAEYQQTEKGVNLHKPVQSQVLHENEKVMGAMPPSAGKLNPRWVETLQGVCMGWTSPSCPASVIRNWPKFVSGWCALTIEPTNCDSSATESCLPPPSELLELFGRNSND